MAHPIGEQDRLALLRGQGHQGISAQEADRESASRRTAQTQQRRGGHVPLQLPHTQWQNQIQGLAQAPHPCIQQMHVDEPQKDGNIPDFNISKTDICSL